MKGIKDGNVSGSEEEQMITSDDILSLNFYNYGNPFTGSYQGMRYRIVKQKETKDEEGRTIKEEGLLAAIWPEPFAYEKTADELNGSRDLRLPSWII